MRKELLIATATIALIAGASAAQAQGTSQPQPHGMSAQPSGAAPAKSDTKADTKRHETTGQASGTSGATGGKSSTQGTTGQGGQARPLGGFNDRSGNAKDDDAKKDEHHSQAGDSNHSGSQMKSETTGESTKSGTSRSSQENMNSKPGQANGENREHNQTTGQAVSPAGRGGASVSISTQQRSEVRDVFVKEHPARVSHVDFKISVGVSVPRSVHLVRLPPRVVEIVPEYRDYLYVMVGDQIVIVDPDSYQIVAVIDV